MLKTQPIQTKSKKKSEKGLASVKKWFGLGLRNLGLNLGLLKTKTRLAIKTQIGKHTRLEYQHFIIELKELGEKLIDVRFVEKENILNGLI